jgi:guanine deaminase
MPHRIIGTFVHTPDLGQLEILHDHVMTVNDDGFITEFHPSDPNVKLSTPGRNVPTLVLPGGSFLCPTFIDAHLHAPQYMFLGNGLDLPLMQWLYEYTYKAEAQIDQDPSLARRVYSQLAQRLIENGTSAVLLFGTIKSESKYVDTNNTV